ncbi:hypothetical protein H2198_007215 [Neophaeococcomyces mojaviensis]|uniref:Uncharacterized protein n=1 Tax=Neophaeococcomyces mojaviensis TaxID=3383035 RepID=A0ACC3A0W3_9EURO|nr:hypothetical protein H2198_007215 [Knufia sp. JES_112]
MFKPVRAPKEGRSPPGLLYTGPTHGSRAKFSQRQVAVVLIVAVCILMGYFVLNSEGGTISSSSTTVVSKPGSGGLGDALLNENTQFPPADANVHEVHAEIPTKDEKPKFKVQEDLYANDQSKDHVYKPVKEPLEDIYQQPTTQPPIEKIKQEKQDVEDEIKSSTSKTWKPKGNDKVTHGDKSAPAPAREKWSDRPQFEKALSKVVSMLPDEVHMRELIRPVEISGKERMREMGLRTRAYKMYFEAWEDLHMTEDSEGATYIRDDVIQYLRSRQQSTGDDESSEEGIDGMNLAQTIRSYEAFRSFLQKFAKLLFPWTAPYFSDHMTLHSSFKKGGRGIVLTVGDDQAPYLLTTIYTFRQLGCTLPIEVMYLGDQDLGEDYRMELESLPGVTTRDIAQMTDDKGWKLAGWAAKPFAILLSSFREVIFIDADSLFFHNPEVLFDDPDYVKHGALFFRDRLIMPESKKRWLQQVLPKPIPKLAKQSRFWTGESGHMQESGVIVVDKWKHFISMMLVTRLNGPDRDGNKEKGIVGVYDMMYGDKETFWIGFLLAGDEEYAFHAGDAGIMGEIEEKDKKKELKKRGEPEEAEIKGPEDKKEEAAKENDQAELGFPDTDSAILQDVVIDENPSNYTICAPQLLHLDAAGRPLWFNGWLLHNKFADKTKKRFANFDHYLVEPRDIREPGAWQLAESNMCCLTTDADKKFEFSKKERETLQMILSRAHEMGMGDQH